MLMATLASALVLAAAPLDDDQLPANTRLNVLHGSGPSNGAGGHIGRTSNGFALGIDSLPNFSSYFYLPGVFTDPYTGDLNVSFNQFTWPYTMIGRAPFGEDSSDHTTKIGAPIIPVAIDLRNFDGSPRFCTTTGGAQVRLFRHATPHVTPVLNSPVFSNARYSSSERPTQFTDAVHRASFFKTADDDWHTILRPAVRQERTLTLIRGTYRFATDPDTCAIRYVLVDYGTFVSKLFPPLSTDTSTLIGAAEHAGDMTTQDLTTFLFPDTYLMFSDGSCCVLGFHSFDVEPGGADNGFRERRYVVDYSSWISPGLFGDAFVDITALSHELAEAFADPFILNVTPWWLAPNGVCQDNLEVGDVIEGLPNATFPMTMNGMTYHPQNEALLQWFAAQTPSRAIHGAYSYPDETVLPTPSVSLAPGCGGMAGPFAGH